MQQAQTAGPAGTAAGPQDGGPAGARQVLRFRLGEAVFGVAIDAVREILQVGAMTALPLMPEFVRGVMNLRGAVVPVIDLAARMGLAVSSLGRRSCIARRRRSACWWTRCTRCSTRPSWNPRRCSARRSIRTSSPAWRAWMARCWPCWRWTARWRKTSWRAWSPATGPPTDPFTFGPAP
jgi:CheW-like domain